MNLYLLFVLHFLLHLLIINVNSESIFHYNTNDLYNYKLYKSFNYDYVEIIYNKMHCNNWKDIIMYENTTKLIPEENRILYTYLMINDINKQIILYVDNEFINTENDYTSNRKKYEDDYEQELNMLKYTISEHINKLYYKYPRYNLIFIGNEYESNILQLFSIYLNHKYNIFINTLYSFYSKNEDVSKIGNEKKEELIKNSIIYRYRVINEYQNEYQNKDIDKNNNMTTLYNINLVNHSYKLCEPDNIYCFNKTDKITPLKVNCGYVKLNTSLN